MHAVNPGAYLVRLVSYGIRGIAALSGFVLLFGSLWFIGAPGTGLASGGVEIAAGLAAMVCAFLPFSTVERKGIGRFLWAVCVLLPALNLTTAIVGVLQGRYSGAVLTWASISAITVLALLGIAALTSSRRSIE